MNKLYICGMEKNLLQSLYDESILVDVENGRIFKKGYHQKINGHGGLRYVETYKLNGTKDGGYIYHSVNKKIKRLCISEHRLVMSSFVGRKLDKTEIVDHINNIRDDNRIVNLRITTSSENQKNLSDTYARRIEINDFTNNEIENEEFKILSDYYPEFFDRKNEHLISNLGRLKYYNRRKKEWVIKNPYLTSSVQFYPIFDFNLNKYGRHNISVHKMVAKCFLDEKPNGDIVIDHIDNNQTNNRVTNLRYISRQQNTIIAFQNNQYNIETQTQSQSKDYSSEDINEILDLFYNQNKTINFLQTKYGHNRITEILKGKTYKNLCDKKWDGVFSGYKETRDKNSKIARTQKRGNYKRKKYYE